MTVGRSFVGPILRVAVLARDLLIAVLAVAVLAPLALLPKRVAAAVGELYGRVASLCWSLGRRTAMINLRRAYGPTMTRALARSWTRQAFRHMALAIVDLLQFARRFGTGSPGWEQEYEPADAELEARIHSDPRPKIFVTAHLGSWEVAIMLASLRVGGRGAVVTRVVDNPFLDAAIRRVRIGRAARWIDKRGAVLAALDRLRRGESVALLLDENAGYRGVFVDFFGRPASTGRTAALLAIRTGAPIIVGAAWRQASSPKLRFELAQIEAPGDDLDAVGAVTQSIASILEGWIRRDPTQWRWMHWRWKTRPDGREETYGRGDLAACFRDPDPRASEDRHPASSTV